MNEMAQPAAPPLRNSTASGRRRLWTLVIVVVLSASACGGAGAVADERVPVEFVVIDRASTSLADQAVIRAQDALRGDPADDGTRLELASALLDKSEQQADVTLFDSIETLLDDLRRRDPDDVSVIVASGRLEMTRNRFHDASRLAERALAVEVDDERAKALLIDARTALGRYDDALAGATELVAQRATSPAWLRLGTQRELRGDLNGAIEALAKASETPDLPVLEQARAQTRMGDVLLVAGRVAEAEGRYASAEKLAGRFPGALAGRAAVLVTRGEFAEAASLWEAALAGQPLSHYAVALGDSLVAAGRPDDALRAYDRARDIVEHRSANGVDTTLESALLDTLLSPGPQAVAAARRAVKKTPTVAGHDALAWSLHQTGSGEAVRESRKAVATGTMDPQVRFHAAVIADANGDRESAREHLRHVTGGNSRFSPLLYDDVQFLALRLGVPLLPAGGHVH